MDHTHSPAGSQIRARMHPDALDRMPMFFDASASTAFVELIQNARRASATRVDIAVQPTPPPLKFRCRVSVRDDGHGIADPAVLLSFGESRWGGKVARAENAAGMGLLCVAKRGCAVSSRARIRAAEYPPAWRVALEPEHFAGKAAAAVFPDDTAPEPNGTCVTFEAGESLESLEAAATAVARYAPLPVTFNGEALKRDDFLEGALHIEQWNGLRLAVLKSRQPLYNEPDLNFHGLTVNVRLPHVQSLDGETWTVRAEVGDCPELQLVLPARKEAVENGFLGILREEARLAIYRALAPADPPPRMAFEDHARAAGAGIELPVPPAKLSPWEPASADVDDWSRDNATRARGTGRPCRRVRRRSAAHAAGLSRRQTREARRNPVRGRPPPGRLCLVRRAGARDRRQCPDHHRRRDLHRAGAASAVQGRAQRRRRQVQLRSPGSGRAHSDDGGLPAP